MENNKTIELRDPERYPDEAVLRGVLGSAYEAYEELMAVLAERKMVSEWRYYRDGKAWLCKVQHRKRTMVWMSVWKGYVQACIYVPEQHLETVYGLGISEEMKQKILNTNNVGRSKPCIFELRSPGSLDDFLELLRFKMGI